MMIMPARHSHLIFILTIVNSLRVGNPCEYISAKYVHGLVQCPFEVIDMLKSTSLFCILLLRFNLTVVWRKECMKNKYSVQ